MEEESGIGYGSGLEPTVCGWGIEVRERRRNVEYAERTGLKTCFISCWIVESWRGKGGVHWSCRDRERSGGRPWLEVFFLGRRGGEGRAKF